MAIVDIDTKNAPKKPDARDRLFRISFFIILRGFGSICGELELIIRFEALQGDISRGFVKTKTSDESFMIHFPDL